MQCYRRQRHWKMYKYNILWFCLKSCIGGHGIKLKRFTILSFFCKIMYRLNVLNQRPVPWCDFEYGPLVYGLHIPQLDLTSIIGQCVLISYEVINSTIKNILYVPTINVTLNQKSKYVAQRKFLINFKLFFLQLNCNDKES